MPSHAHRFSLAHRRSSTPTASPAHAKIAWIPRTTIGNESAGPAHAVLNTVVCAGYFARETFEEPRWAEEVRMDTTCAVGPLFAVQEGAGGKCEGGGDYAHHASKSALNMVGKLLSLDLAPRGIAVALVHARPPGFMGTEMRKNVGYDQYWDSGGAVTPDEAAASLIPFVDAFTVNMTGQYWAPRGARDIGTAEAVLGKDLPTPLQLPW
ncbi:oxidoreductase [Mycena latifolia]|nr:oxidoreductase [Mycena latifolia]